MCFSEAVRKKTFILCLKLKQNMQISLPRRLCNLMETKTLPQQRNSDMSNIKEGARRLLKEKNYKTKTYTKTLNFKCNKYFTCCPF